jgi:hypothetical protein
MLLGARAQVMSLNVFPREDHSSFPFKDKLKYMRLFKKIEERKSVLNLNHYS